MKHYKRKLYRIGNGNAKKRNEMRKENRQRVQREQRVKSIQNGTCILYTIRD